MERLLQHISANSLEAYVFDGDDNIKPFVFMSISKCAKTSIWKNLNRNVNGHKIDKYNVNEYIGEDYTDYYKFCFVRNTYDRLVSAYKFFQLSRVIRGFDNFVNDYVVNLDRYLSFTKPNKKRRLASHLQRQDKFIEFSIGDTFIDNVYSFENIGQDWRKLRRFLNLRNKRLGHYRKSHNNDVHYSQYYSDQTLELIRSVYGRELDLFGFKCAKPKEDIGEILL